MGSTKFQILLFVSKQMTFSFTEHVNNVFTPIYPHTHLHMIKKCKTTQNKICNI